MILDEKLKELNACEDARKWAEGKTWEEIHKTCHRGDWLLWLFKKTSPNKHRELTLAKAHCAATVLHLMKDERSKNAIAVAIKYGNNEATSKELSTAATAAAYAYTAAYDAATAAAYDAATADAAATAAYDAATAAATAAYAADAAAAYAYTDAYDADAAAAYAAYAADAAAYAAYAAADKTKNQLETADICRQYLPIEIWEITN